MDDNMEETDNIIILNNENGEEVKFEFLDLVDLVDLLDLVDFAGFFVEVSDLTSLLACFFIYFSLTIIT